MSSVMRRMQNRRKRIKDLQELVASGTLDARSQAHYEHELKNELNEQRRMNK